MGFQVGGNNPMSIISIYGHGKERDSATLWRSLQSISTHAVIMGDINMVEHQEHKYKLQGMLVNGAEKRTWDQVKDSLNLHDIGTIRDFS